MRLKLNVDTDQYEHENVSSTDALAIATCVHAMIAMTNDAMDRTMKIRVHIPMALVNIKYNVRNAL